MKKVLEKLDGMKGRKIYFVISDIPIPVGLPFGYFPDSISPSASMSTYELIDKKSKIRIYSVVCNSFRSNNFSGIRLQNAQAAAYQVRSASH